MTRLAFLLICFACIAVGFTIKAALDNDAIAKFFSDYAFWIAVAALAGLLGLGATLLLGYLYARQRLRKLLTTDGVLSAAQIAEGLVDMFTTPEGVSNPTNADRQRAALINAGTWLMRRQAAQFYFNVTVTVMGGLIGTATLFLLYEQNQKIDLQNEKITLQTDADITESVLLEGTRRAALASDMSTLFQDIRAASTKLNVQNPKSKCIGPQLETPLACWLWAHDDRPGNAVFIPSAEMRARIVAFAQRSTPYRLAVTRPGVLEFDTRLREQFEFPSLSPERGQLFETLTLNKVYTGSYRLDFAQLTGADLRKRSMQDAKLAGAHLREANLSDSNLAFAVLQSADLTQAVFDRAYLRGSKLRGVLALSARFRSANLDGVVLNSAWMTDSDMTGRTIAGSNRGAGKS